MYVFGSVRTVPPWEFNQVLVGVQTPEVQCFLLIDWWTLTSNMYRVRVKDLIDMLIALENKIQKEDRDITVTNSGELVEWDKDEQVFTLLVMG